VRGGIPASIGPCWLPFGFSLFGGGVHSQKKLKTGWPLKAGEFHKLKSLLSFHWRSDSEHGGEHQSHLKPRP